jgi:pyruvate dehydrogenase E1 component alpha subunit
MTTKTASADKAKKGAASSTTFPKETYLRWFKEMILMRRFEEKTGQLYTMQKFGGFCHL